MCARGDVRTFLLQCLEEGLASPDAEIIADLELPISFIERGVEITADQNFFTSDISELLKGW